MNHNDESILDKVTKILNESENESMFKTGPMDGDSGLDHPSTSLHQTCECSIYTMNIFLSNLAMRTYPDPETPIFQIKTKLNTVGHYDFDARGVTRWMRSIEANSGSDVYSAPLKQFGGRFGILDNDYTFGEDDGLEAKLGYGLQLTFHVDRTPQGFGIIARMEKVFTDDESDMMPEPVMAEEENQLDEGIITDMKLTAMIKSRGGNMTNETSLGKKKVRITFPGKEKAEDFVREFNPKKFKVSGKPSPVIDNQDVCINTGRDSGVGTHMKSYNEFKESIRRFVTIVYEDSSFQRYMAGGKAPNQVRYKTKWIPAPKNRLGTASNPATGQRVKIVSGSGIDSNKEGNIRPWSEMKTDGRGIPTNLANNPYKPVDRNSERLIRFDDGTMVTMYTNRLLIPTQGDMIKESSHRHNLNKKEEFTVVVTKNNKVVAQLPYVLGSEVDAAIDLYKEMHGKDATVSIENKSGKIVYTE